MRTAVEAESGIHPVADGLYVDAEQVGNVRALRAENCSGFSVLGIRGMGNDPQSLGASRSPRWRDTRRPLG